MRLKVLAALVFALLAGCWVAHGQTIIGFPRMPLNSANPCVTCTQFTNANTAAWAGGVNMNYTNKAIVGISDSKTFTCSFWIYMTAFPTGPILFQIINNLSVRFQVQIHPSNALQVDAKNSAGSGILQGISDTGPYTLNAWYHTLIVVDLSNTNNRHIYINGVDRATAAINWPTYVNDTIDLVPATPIRALGNDYTSQTTGLVGSLAEFWLSDQYIDQLCYFRCTVPSGAHPATLTATGQTFGNNNPALYLSRVGNADSWVNDSSGNGNHFSSAIGSLGTAASSP